MLEIVLKSNRHKKAQKYDIGGDPSNHTPNPTHYVSQKTKQLKKLNSFSCTVPSK